MEKIRTIKLFRNYYKEFYVAQTDDVRQKINQVLKMIETQRIVPIKFFRHIEGSDGIYEVRVEVEQKTPPKEIRRAEAIRKEYFKSKEEE